VLAEQYAFSLVDDEPPLRWQRAVRLAPRTGFGVVRRAVFFGLLGWLPIAVWAWTRGLFVNGSAESLLQHYGVHVRCLLVIPLLVLGEASFHEALRRYLPQFFTSRLVDERTRPSFDAALQAVGRWRDYALPWLFVIGLALAWTFADPATGYTDELSWAFDERGRLGFGGVWFVYVVRPVFLVLLLGWLWRIVLLVTLAVRLTRLPLSLVPSHPDRLGGLGFVEKLPIAFAPLGFALSAMLASRWAHEIVHHQKTLAAFKLPAAMFIVAWSLLLLAPFVPLAPILHKARRAALPSYAAMVAEQGRLVRRRWIDRTSNDDSPLIEPAGIGVMADAATMYLAVRAMRSFPLGKTSLLAIAVPIAVPMLLVAALQIPVKTMLLGVVKTLL
jgi:hypothetical protein